MKKAERGFFSLSRSTELMRTSMNRVSAGFGELRMVSLAAAAAVGGAVFKSLSLIDTYTNLQNRLRTVTEGQEQLNEVTQRLFDISNQTRTSMEATAEIYARIGLAAKELGVTQNDLLNFTESLNQAVILSGASATEATNGLIQLSQGIASGALRGDELRSVLEQLPVVADVISERLGVTRGQLREMGKEGKITADIVLSAFAAARDSLEQRFAKTIPTMGQSLTVLKNRFLELFGSIENQTELGRRISQFIIKLSDNLEGVGDVIIELIKPIEKAFELLSAGAEKSNSFLGALGLSFKDVAIFAGKVVLALAALAPIGLVIGGLVSTASGLVSIMVGLGGALVAAITGPVLPILAGIGLAFMIIKKDGESVKDTFMRIFEALKVAASKLSRFFAPTIVAFKEFAVSIWQFVTEIVVPTFKALMPVFAGVMKVAIGTFGVLWQILVAILKTIAKMIEWITTLGKKIGGLVSGPFKKAMEFMGLSTPQQDQISIPQPGDTLGPVPPTSQQIVEAQLTSTAASVPDIEGALEKANKKDININNKTDLCIDGRRMSTATARHRVEIQERAGSNQQPWQKRQIQIQGVEAAPV